MRDLRTTSRRLSAAVAALTIGVGGTFGVAQASPDATAAATAAATKRVPNVVGMNHQAAQDYLQDRGFYNLRERDCSGRGRMLLWDRNWHVVRQSPRAGRRVSTSRAITLCSIKYTD